MVDPDPGWAARAELERRRILERLGEVAVRVDHVGSTSVPGLAAKPILDLQLSVDALEPRERYATPLAALGYVFVPDPDSADYPFFARPARRTATHHLHVCLAGSEHERRHLAVRDYLRSHPDQVARYAAIKRHLAARHPQDRQAYVEGKDGVVRDLQRRALAWAGARPD